MHLKEGYVLRELGDDAIVIGEGTTVDFQHLVSLNSSAAWLWRQVEGREFDVRTLTELLLGEYEVGEAEAAEAAEEIAEAWVRAGLAEK
ncbi:MAG: PqqD family protein [Bacteroidales bacterium]|nr:PqqD family protein [Bacteroidales bacterium]